MKITKDDIQLIPAVAYVLITYENLHGRKKAKEMFDILVDEIVNKINKKIENISESKYTPKYDLGTKLYMLDFGGVIREVEIIKIEIKKTKNGIKYVYFTDEYPPFEDIKESKVYFLTKEEAQKAFSEYVKEYKEMRKKEIAEKYERIKKEYEEIMKEE